MTAHFSASLDWASAGAPSAAIVGAGLAGLAAAYRLQGAGWRVRIFEASGEVGGRVQTVARDGYLLDTGASALADSYRAYFALANELGLGDEIVRASSQFGIYRDGRVHLIDLDRPIASGMATALFSVGAKLRVMRLAWDVARAWQRGELDFADMRKAAPLDTETARDYALRRLGPELADYLCDAVVRMMLIADAGRISKVELFSGLANILGTRISALKGGQQRMARALAAQLDVRLQQPVLKVAHVAAHYQVESRDAEGALHAEAFDACVIACPLQAAASVCEEFAPLQSLARKLRYTRALTVAIGTRRPPVSPAFMIQMPACEDDSVALLFLEHNKAPDRAPAGRGLIGCDWEAEASGAWFDRSDQAIVERTLRTVLRVCPELDGHIEFAHVTRWRDALPYTRVGAYRLMGEFAAALAPDSRLQFAADFMSGAGQNTAVEFGNRAAARLIRQFPRPTPACPFPMTVPARSAASA
jgi:oxygen-dependent protoporphyrinogen oxidase